jgi:hypothetical protein
MRTREGRPIEQESRRLTRMRPRMSRARRLPERRWATQYRNFRRGLRLRFKDQVAEQDSAPNTYRGSLAWKFILTLMPSYSRETGSHAGVQLSPGSGEGQSRKPERSVRAKRLANQTLCAAGHAGPMSSVACSKHMSGDSRLLDGLGPDGSSYSPGSAFRSFKLLRESDPYRTRCSV